MSDEIVGPACFIGPFPGWDVPHYDRLFSIVVSTLNGNILPLPRLDDPERDAERVAMAVRDATGLPLERWDRLDPAGREPWLAATLDALSTPNSSGRATLSDPEEAPPLGGIPPEFREDEEPEGEPLTPAYMLPSDDPIRHRKIGGEKWGFRSAYLSNNFGDGKTLTRRVKVGNTYAYCYAELLKLRERKLAYERKRYG